MLLSKSFSLNIGSTKWRGEGDNGLWGIICYISQAEQHLLFGLMLVCLRNIPIMYICKQPVSHVDSTVNECFRS